jgi:hypothetical protein
MINAVAITIAFGDSHVSGGDEVKAFDPHTLAPIRDFLAYGSSTAGLFVAGETRVPEPFTLAISCGAVIGLTMRRRKKNGAA